VNTGDGTAAFFSGIGVMLIVRRRMRRD
jgi:hypothetical protein